MRLAHPWLRPLLRHLPTLLPVAALLAFWLAGANQGGWRVDNGLYAAISKYAYETGNLLHLYAGDQPYFNKPPLAFWAHGLALHLFGSHLWAARLPSLIAAIACTLVTMRLARTLAGPRVAMLTGIVLVTTLEFFRHMRAIALDLWQALWIVAAVWLIAEAIKRDRTRFILLAGVPLGLALMTKPLIGLAMIPILAIWMIWSGRARQSLWLGASALIAVLIAAPWHINMILAFPGEFAPQYFLKQTLQRATGEASDRAPWWEYISIFGRHYWPWLPALLLGSLLAFARPPLDPRARLRAAAERLCILWIFIWLIALSIFADKAGRYALLLYPAMALLSALWLARRAPRPITIAMRALERWMAPVLLAGSIALAALGVSLNDPPDPAWASLTSELSRRGNPAIWASPHASMRWITCNVYLETGDWPRTATPDGALARAQGFAINPRYTGIPQIGDLMIFTTGSPVQPRAADHVVWESGKLFLVELSSEWDGMFTARAATDISAE